MKKITFFLVFSLSSIVTFGQALTFKNSTGDYLWSNRQNWRTNSNGVPTQPVTGAGKQVIIEADCVIVSGDYQVAQIKLTTNSANTVKIHNSNNSTLTLTSKNLSVPIKVEKVNQSLIFNLPVIFDEPNNATNKIATYYSTGQRITFGAGHSLTLNDQLTFAKGTGADDSNQLHFDGELIGSGTLKLGYSSDAYFLSLIHI